MKKKKIIPVSPVGDKLWTFPVCDLIREATPLFGKSGHVWKK